MKKITMIPFLLISVVLWIFLFIQYKKSQPAFTLEWHEITPQTAGALQPTFQMLKPIDVASFLSLIKPYVYAHDPRLTSIPAEKRHLAEPKVVAAISESLQASWDKKLAHLYADLQEKKAAAAYVAIAYDAYHNPLGFALFEEKYMKEYLAKGLERVVEQWGDQAIVTSQVPDQAYVALLAVLPGSQKKGLGKALVFEVLSHCPHIKRIYLATSAHEMNKQAQGFYEHIGFKLVLKGVFVLEEGRSEFDREKIVYLYQKPKAQ